MKMFEFKNLVTTSLLSLGLAMGLSTPAEAAFGAPVIDVVNAEFASSFSVTNSEGDVFSVYKDITVAPNLFYGAVWNFNNSSWDASKVIVDSTTINLPSAGGTVQPGISPSGNYRAAAWRELTTLKTIVSLDSGSGFNLLTAVPDTTPGSFNTLQVGVNNAGYVAVLSVQGDAPVPVNDLFYASVWNGSAWTQLQLGSFSDAFWNFIAPVQVDSSGNFHFYYASQSGTTTSIYTSVYTVSTGLISAPVLIASITDAFSNSATDPTPTLRSTFINGGVEAIELVLVDTANTLNKYYTTINATGTWTTPVAVTDGVPAYPNRALNGTPSFGVGGNGVAQFTYSLLNAGIYTLYSAKVSATSSTVVTDVITSSTNEIRNPKSDTDNYGNAVVTWKELNPAGAYTATQTQGIVASTRSGLTGAWQTPVTIVTDLSLNSLWAQSFVKINNLEAVIATFVKLPGNGTLSNTVISNLDVSVALNIFIPQPAEDFAGKEVKNKFATQTDIINLLGWVASPDPTVVSYNIYRNGVLIANVPSTSLTYQDHNRRKGVTYTYVIRAVNGAGLESADQTIVLIDS